MRHFTTSQTQKDRWEAQTIWANINNSLAEEEYRQRELMNAQDIEQEMSEDS